MSRATNTDIIEKLECMEIRLPNGELEQIQNDLKDIKEILLVTSNLLDLDKNYNSSLFFENVMDQRQMPTIFLSSEIEQAINNKDESNLFLLILVSLNNKEWIEIHPEHLKLVLKGIKKYKNSELLKNTLLDIFENNKMF